MEGVQFESVAKTYDNGVKVLHQIDLDVREGEFVVFVGPSGCGKSTLMRMVAGLESVSEGRISIGGRVVNGLPPRERDIAMVFQDYALYPHKTVFENMAFGLRLRKVPQAEIEVRVREAADILQLGHLLDRKPRQLSGGQRQRVAMGRAIVRQAKVFLFDEPLSNLDAKLRNEMRVEIKKLHQRLGSTMIYVTHDQVEAMTLADRIAVMSAGHVMQYGTPDQIYNQPRTTFVAGFTGSPAMNLVKLPVQRHQDGLAVHLGHALVPMPAHIAERCMGEGLGEVVFGVRPENIATAPAPDGSAALAAEVIVVEPLGAETLCTMKIDAHELVARLSANTRVQAGDRITVNIDVGKTRWFDAANGMTLAA